MNLENSAPKGILKNVVVEESKEVGLNFMTESSNSPRERNNVRFEGFNISRLYTEKKLIESDFYNTREGFGTR